MKNKLFTLLLAVVASVGLTSAAQLWPIILDGQTYGQLEQYVVSDFRPDEIDNFLYIWENTYTYNNATGKNSFSNDEGYLSLITSSLGWSGLGYCMNKQVSVTAIQSLKNAIVANPDNYYLHLSIKSTDHYSHCFYVMETEGTKFVLGNKSVYDGPVYSDFPRDGAWHEFYIPMSGFASAIASANIKSGTNLFVALSEGVAGAQLNLDAVYFCDKEMKDIITGVESINRVKIGDLYYNLDETSQTAEVSYNGVSGSGWISVMDNSLADWDVLPAKYVSEATCPNDAAMLGLKSVKVFADAQYINILVEPNMEDITDTEWVPFHVFIDTDNSDATGGYGDEFTDANADIMLETALFAEGQPYNYNPAVFKWWGEVGGDGWEWTNPSVAHDGSDYWGAIIGEGQLPIGKSQYVNGKFEIQIDRTIIPATWNTTEFGIGFDIQQNWSSVGILPCTSLTDENPAGHAKKLKVKIANEQAPGSHEISGSVIIPATVSYKGKSYSVTSIVRSAFYGRSGLTSVTIGKNITSIGENAFYGCSGLTSIESPAILFNEAFDIFALYDNEMPSRIKNLTINAGSLTEEGFDRIHASYRNLESVDLTKTENTELSDEAFKGCYNLQTLRLPAGLTKIGYMAVAECKNLKTITIPASVEVIEQSAFENCRSVTSVTFEGNAVKSIGSWAFYNCHALQSITIPDGVTEIGDGAFYGCTYLANVSVPASARIIGDNAFALCSKMAKMTVGAVEPPVIAAKTFEEVSRSMPVYVPKASVQAYKADPLWGQMNIIGSETAIEEVGFAPAASKILRNGEVLILRDGKTYTVQGQEVR